MTKQEQFKKFWSLYPRKVAKVAAERGWKKLTIKEIKDIYEVYHDHLIRWRYTEIQFVPHASTWINQKRWQDELEPLPDQNQSIYKNIEKQRKDFMKKMKEAEKSSASDEDRKKALRLKK